MTYFLKALKKVKLNYVIYDNELMAIIIVFKIWKPLVNRFIKSFNIYSNHKNPTRFMITKILNKCWENCIILLSKFNFKIHYIKNKENIQADILSRRGEYDAKILKRRI